MNVTRVSTPDNALRAAMLKLRHEGVWVGEKKEQLNHSVQISDATQSTSDRGRYVGLLDEHHGEDHFETTVNWTFPEDVSTGLTGEPKPSDKTGDYFDRLVDSPKGNQLVSMVEKIDKWGRNNRTCAQVFQVERDLNAMFPPCLMMLQAFYRGEKLHLTAYFRSHTVAKSYLGDVVALGRLQSWLATQVDAEPGLLVVHSGSLHVRKKNDEHKLMERMLDV